MTRTWRGTWKPADDLAETVEADVFRQLIFIITLFFCRIIIKYCQVGIASFAVDEQAVDKVWIEQIRSISGEIPFENISFECGG